MQTRDCTSSAECYCIPLGPCYNVQQFFYIDHCQLKELQGHAFQFDFTVLNGAGLQTTKTYNVSNILVVEWSSVLGVRGCGV